MDALVYVYISSPIFPIFLCSLPLVLKLIQSLDQPFLVPRILSPSLWGGVCCCSQVARLTESMALERIEAQFAKESLRQEMREEADKRRYAMKAEK